jgi:hypothetical protein
MRGNDLRIHYSEYTISLDLENIGIKCLLFGLINGKEKDNSCQQINSQQHEIGIMKASEYTISVSLKFSWCDVFVFKIFHQTLR